MDTRLLRHYEAELAYLREMGAEFSEAYPKVASRLGMEGLEVADPYVERLLEGSAFLAARVQLELELQYPAFTAHLLDVVYPHYLAPTPSMMVARLDPEPDADGFVLPRGTVLRSGIPDGASSPCQFRTAADLPLWPLEIAEAEYVEGRGSLVAAGVSGAAEDARAAIRLRFRRQNGAALSELPVDMLRLFVGNAAPGGPLHEMLCAESCALVARSPDRSADWVMPVAGGRVSPAGLDPDEALLPRPPQSFDGYRLLQEYFAMPERFQFLDLEGLSTAFARADGPEVDLYVLLRHGRAEIGREVVADAFQLNCVPAANLFEKRCDRVPVGTHDTECHVVPDRTAPLDFEVHSLVSVTGISSDGGRGTEFRPFYSSDDLTAAGAGEGAYYVHTRRARARNEKERLRGTRTGYLGFESFLELVDSAQAPFAADLKQLSVRAMVTNRDLPLLLPSSGRDVFRLPDGGPVRRITTPVPPTRPRPPLAQGDAAWRAIGHLSLNYLSITDTNGEEGSGAAALRELVGLYAPPGQRALARQVEGITGVSTRPIVRRLADEVLSTAVRGLEITLETDEAAFEGTSPYQLALVLERFLARQVSLNSFTETVLRTQQRGEVARWTPRTGTARLI